MGTLSLGSLTRKGGYVLCWLCIVLAMYCAGYVLCWLCIVLAMYCAGYVLCWLCIVLAMYCAGYIVFKNSIYTLYIHQFIMLVLLRPCPITLELWSPDGCKLHKPSADNSK